MGPCAKKVVSARLMTKDGSIYYGRNDCHVPQAKCPRLPGDDYTKCGTVCRQPFHAEIDAIQQAIMAGKSVEDAHMIIFNHRACPDCAVTMSHFKVTWETRT